MPVFANYLVKLMMKNCKFFNDAWYDKEESCVITGY